MFTYACMCFILYICVVMFHHHRRRKATWRSEQALRAYLAGCAQVVSEWRVEGTQVLRCDEAVGAVGAVEAVGAGEGVRGAGEGAGVVQGAVGAGEEGGGKPLPGGVYLFRDRCACF